METAPPPPEIINKKKEYKVEEVQNYRKQERGTQFLVYQKDYGNKHNQWIVKMGLPHAKEVIQNYWTMLSR